MRRPPSIDELMSEIFIENNSGGYDWLTRNIAWHFTPDATIRHIRHSLDAVVDCMDLLKRSDPVARNIADTDMSRESHSRVPLRPFESPDLHHRYVMLSTVRRNLEQALKKKEGEQPSHAA